MRLVKDVDPALCDNNSGQFDEVPEPEQPIHGDMRIKLLGVVHGEDYFNGPIKVLGLDGELHKALGFTAEDKPMLRTDDSHAAIRVNSIKVGRRYTGNRGDVQEKLSYEEVVVDYHIERPKGNNDQNWVPERLHQLRELLADKPARGEPGKGIYDRKEYRFLSRAYFEGPELWVVKGPLIGIGDEKYLPYADVKIGLVGLVTKEEIVADLEELFGMTPAEGSELLPWRGDDGRECLTVQCGDGPTEAFVDFRLKRAQSRELARRFPVMQCFDGLCDMWEEAGSDLYTKSKILQLTDKHFEPRVTYASPEEEETLPTLSEIARMEKAPYADGTVKLWVDIEQIPEGSERRHVFFTELARELEALMGVEPTRKGNEVFMLTNIRDGDLGEDPSVYVDFRVAQGRHKGIQISLPESMGKLDLLCTGILNKHCHIKLGVKYRREKDDDDSVLAVLTGPRMEDVDDEEYFRERIAFEIGKLVKLEEATIPSVVRVREVLEEEGGVRVNFEIHKSPKFGNPGVLGVSATCELINDKVLVGEGALYNDVDTWKFLSQVHKEHHVTSSVQPCEISDSFDSCKWLKRADSAYEPEIIYADPAPEDQPAPQYADVRLAFKLRRCQIRPGGDSERDFTKSFLHEMSSSLGLDSNTIGLLELKRMKVEEGNNSQEFREKVIDLAPGEELKDELTPKTCERIVVSFRLTESPSLLGPKVPEAMYKLRRMVKDTRSPLYRKSETMDTDACSKLDNLINPDIKVWAMNVAETAAFKTGVHSDGVMTLMRFFRCFTMLYGQITDEEFSAKMLQFKSAAAKVVQAKRAALALEEARRTM